MFIITVMFSHTVLRIDTIEFYVFYDHVFFNIDGRQEAVSFDKITSRIQKLCYGLNSDFLDPVSSKHCKVTDIK